MSDQVLLKIWELGPKSLWINYVICFPAGSAGTVGDARSKIGGGKISDARFGRAAPVSKFKI